MTIKNDITTEIDSQIDAMTTVGGYNFNYNNVNEYKPGSKTYPAVKTEYTPDDFLDPDEQMVDSYTSYLVARFQVYVDNTVSPVDLALSRVLEDFERMMEAAHPTLQTKGMIVADLIENNRFYTQIRKRPGYIEMEWSVRYRVKRSDPSVTT